MYQRLNEFIEHPFGNHVGLNLEYKAKYDKYRNTNRIKLVSVSIVDNKYYAHVSIPSESSNMNYDVVILFFTDDPEVEKSNTLVNYKCKFFSNSPSFIYKYASLYKSKGYLIEELYKKLDTQYGDKLPEKTNPKNDLCYDKSLFFACQYLLEHKFVCLSKLSVFFKKTTFDKFIQSIKDYNTIKNDIDNRKKTNDSVSNINKKITVLTDKYNPLKKINLHPGSKIIKPNAKKSKIKPNSKQSPKKRTSGLN